MRHLYKLFLTVVAMGFTFGSQKASAEVLKSLGEAHKNLEANWQDAAQHFIDAHEELDQGLRKILDENGAQPLWDTTIALTLWKENRTFPKGLGGSLLRESTKVPKMGRSKWHSLCWGTEDSFCCCNPITHALTAGLTLGAGCLLTNEKLYYVKDTAEPLIKDYIYLSLRNKDLRKPDLSKAADFWEKKFVNPVSQLLLDHLTEMNKDERSMQLLLNLYRAYHRCEYVVLQDMEDLHITGVVCDNSDRGIFSEYRTQISRVPLRKFREIRRTFYEELADTIVGWDPAGEGENILCALLMDDHSSKIGDKRYPGSLDRAIDIVALVDELNKKMAVGPDPDTHSAIGEAIAIAKKRAKTKQEAIDAYVTGDTAGAAARAHFN